MSAPLPKAIVLAGPTASGKTAAALAIARHLAPRVPVEIISVDSALVFKGMDIGTAKPDAAEMAVAPHHLINIRDPLQVYNAAEFARDTEQLMFDITARGHLPLLVGGTMLYLKALFDGLDELPQANAAVRALLEAEAAALGWPAMHAKLAAVDPVTAARLQPADAQRIQRALEVYALTGQPMSTLHTPKTEAAYAERMGAVAFISLEPEDRAWLHQRIAQRFDAMLAGGFIDEVRTLRARGDLTPDMPSMRCVGYRQAWTALDEDPQLKPATMATLRDQGIAATRQLAKRQITWLRSMPQRQCVAADGAEPVAEVLRLVDAHLARA
jgi:tRNA dimethylallyltransferase